jgi:hypothetical protein
MRAGGAYAHSTIALDAIARAQGEGPGCFGLSGANAEG